MNLLLLSAIFILSYSCFNYFSIALIITIIIGISLLCCDLYIKYGRR